MEITIIRHAKVCYDWKNTFNSKEFDKACSEYDISPIEGSKVNKLDTDNQIFISELQRTYDTACLLFKRRDFIKSGLFNEVPLKSCVDTSCHYSLVVWNVMGRIQWLFNSKRQVETRKQTEKRVDEAITMLEKNSKNCYLICHGFFMRSLIKQLKVKGYSVENDYILGIANLEEIRLSK